MSAVTAAAAGATRRWTAARRLRAVVFAVLALHIAAGPFAAQLLNVKSPFARPWTMFSEVGVGVLDGTFTARYADGTMDELSPLQALGVDRYPVMRSTLYDRRVLKDRDLRLVADRICTDGDVHVAFTGRVGTKQGWRALKADDVCQWPLAAEGTMARYDD